jgi:hypothetical protein
LEPAPDRGVHREHVGGNEVAEKFGLQRGYRTTESTLRRAMSIA